MATTVVCPACGADGTAAADAAIAQALPAQPEAVPTYGARLRTATPTVTPTARPMPPSSLPRTPVSSATAPTKLTWYEQLWIALPIALVGVGGAIGGACGGLAWAINKTVFKKTENPVLRYIWTGLISASAVIIWLVVAAFFLSLFKKH